MNPRGRRSSPSDWMKEKTSACSSSSQAASRSTRQSASTIRTGPSSSTTTRLCTVCETKSTKDFLKLRTSEADKVRCGQKHFETLGVAFSVVTSADEV